MLKYTSTEQLLEDRENIQHIEVDSKRNVPLGIIFDKIFESAVMYAALADDAAAVAQRGVDAGTSDPDVVRQARIAELKRFERAITSGVGAKYALAFELALDGKEFSLAAIEDLDSSACDMFMRYAHALELNV